MTESKLNNPGYEIPEELQNAISITTLDRLYNWGRRSSGMMMFGPACCAIEMIAAQAARGDLARRDGVCA
jgi:NADH-quinone oxidoreductase subunit B